MYFKHISSTFQCTIFCIITLIIGFSAFVAEMGKSLSSKFFHAAIETNNGVEAQNKVLKYSYLPHRRNITLSCLVEILITSFLPDSYEKYLFQNYKMSSAY